MLSALRARAPALLRFAALLAAALVIAPFFWHLARGSIAYRAVLEDDFFYYSLTAGHLAATGRSTFDGLTSTNGYHPLWFAVCALLQKLPGPDGFWWGLACVLCACSLAAVELSRRLARALGAAPIVAGAVGLACAFGSARLAATGMECALAIPLFLWLLCLCAERESSPRAAARIGFAASLAVLARLDLGLAVAMLVSARVASSWSTSRGNESVPRDPRARAGLVRELLAFCAAGSLVPLYLVFNRLHFGLWMPVSALVKQNLAGYRFDWRYLLLAGIQSRYGGRLSGLVLLAGALAAALLAFFRGERDRKLAVGAIALAFAALFFLINACTGWALFAWYLYPLGAAVPCALALAWRRWPRLGAALLALLCAISLFESGRDFWRRGPRGEVADNAMFAMSRELAGRLGERKGVYAAGAVAGFIEDALQEPVFQLEGLVGDRQLLEELRREVPLPDLLAEHRADILIVTFPGPPPLQADGCYRVDQPDPTWARLSRRSTGAICREPFLDFVTPPGKPWIFVLGLRTLAFDLHGARWEK